VSQGQNVTMDVPIGSKCHSGRSELGRNVQAAFLNITILFGLCNILKTSGYTLFLLRNRLVLHKEKEKSWDKVEPFLFYTFLLEVSVFTTLTVTLTKLAKNYTLL
jgi:hypothetical protein